MNSMQKFKVRLKNVPMDTPQVHSSTNHILNKEETLSVCGIVPTLNNPDVDQHQHKGGRDLKKYPVITYVLNNQGRPLMPCSPRKARILLKKGKANVVRTNPFFVIQLKRLLEMVLKSVL